MILGPRVGQNKIPKMQFERLGSIGFKFPRGEYFSVEPHRRSVRTTVTTCTSSSRSQAAREHLQLRLLDNMNKLKRLEEWLIIHSAEASLKSIEQEPGFSLALLQLVASDSVDQTLRLASSLFFKNLIKRRWTDAEGNYLLPENEVTTIKAELIGLMTSVPPAIQTQLGEAISVIADSDFWTRWDTLVDDLVSRLTPDNPVVNNGVLQVAHSVFVRWRPLFRSDPLFEEILHVLSKFGNPFLQLLQVSLAVSEFWRRYHAD